MRGKKRILDKKRLMKTSTFAVTVLIAATLILSSIPTGAITSEPTPIKEDIKIKDKEIKDFKDITADTEKKNTKENKLYLTDEMEDREDITASTTGKHNIRATRDKDIGENTKDVSLQRTNTEDFEDITASTMGKQDKTADTKNNNNIENADVAPTGDVSGSRGSFPIVATIPIPDNVQCVGVGYDGTNFWVSAGDADTGSCMFYLYDEFGNQIDNTTQGGGATGWGHRDLAWNGSEMFGSYSFDISGFSDIYTYDGEFVGVISPNRALAYDGTYFYTSGFGQFLWKLDWDGVWNSTATATQLSAATFAGAYGLAYDSTLNCLWMTTADYTGNLLQLDMSGNILNTYTTLPEYDIHGGCTMANTVTYGDVLVVLAQSDPDVLVFYDIHAPSIDVEKEVFIPFDFPCEYTLCLDDTYGDTWNGGFLDVYVNGVPLYTNISADDLTPGTYQCYPITVNGGDVIFVDYTPGSWTGENVWYLSDCQGTVLWSQTGSPDPNAHDMTETVASGSWVDADDPASAVDFEISTTVEFRITIHNNGMSPVWDVWIYDWFDDSLYFLDADPYPTYQALGYIEWTNLFPGVLYPCETITITVWMHAVGPHCSIDENHAEADAMSDEGFVWDEDSCFVHCKDPIHIDVEKYVEVDGVWVDADDNASAVDVEISTIVEFLITIHNDGMNPLWDIYINDTMDDSLYFVDADPPPSWFDPDAGYIEWWNLAPNGLYPCETITIHVWAHVVGEHCSIDENNVTAEGWNFEIPPYSVWDQDSAFVHCFEPEPGIDVEKYVWDEANEEWVDADTEADAIDLPVSTIATFLIAIHNNGTRDLADIYVYDLMNDSMEFVDADPPPDSVVPVPGGTELVWFFPGLLSPCNWINITVFAHVVGPNCSIDENYVHVGGYAAGDPVILWDQYDTDGSNGLSNFGAEYAGYRRALLDDFEITDPDGWTINDFHMLGVWNTLPPGSGWDWNLSFWSDNAGVPGALIATAVDVSYTEIATGRIWFGRQEFEVSYYFEDIFLPQGTYWIWGHVVGLDNCFWMAKQDVIWGSQCWVDWEDFTPNLQNITNITGAAFDLAFQLTAKAELGEYVWDEDSAFIHATEAEPEVPSIDVEKQVLIPFEYPCDYQICLYDSYGDGWDFPPYEPNNYVLVYVNGVEVGNYTLVTGYGPECHDITVNGGDEITTDYVARGSYPSENSYEILDCSGTVVRTEGAAGVPGDILPGELIVPVGIWYDADTVADAIDIPVSTIVEFRIAIHNNGTDDLANIYVYDLMNDSMEFVDADPPPDSVVPVPGGTELVWFFPGLLPPCSWINITVFAHVVGPHCSIDENYVYVEGYWYDTIVLWNNGGPFDGNLVSSQNDTCYPFISQTADDFMFDETTVVDDVHWWGGFWNTPEEAFDPCDFAIYIYADNGTGNAPTGGGLPDPAPTALASYFLPGVSGLPLDSYGNYEYHAYLNPPFTAVAGVKYWIAIQAVFCFTPQWGWATTAGIQLASAVQGFPLLGTAFWTTLDPVTDMAFYLTGIIGEELVWDEDSAFIHAVDIPSIDVEKQVLVPFDFPCDYQICLYDSWGDGWNDGVVDVYVNGVLIYDDLTIISGSGPECYPIPVMSGDVITTNYTAGSYPSENSYEILDCNGNVVRTEGAGGAVPGDILPGELIVPVGVWVDADTENEAVDFAISTIVEFRITIHNDGNFPVYGINLYDYFDDSLEFVAADPPPTFVGPGYLEWIPLYPGVLNPCETITIMVWMHVVGPHCSIDENYAYADALTDVEPYFVEDGDSAFIHAVEPPPSIDVEKYVKVDGDWVDADTENEAVDVEISTIVEFLIAIHNDGTGYNLTDIYVYDLMDDSMAFVDADPPPDSVVPVPGVGTELIWNFSGPLSPCNWINITVTAHVVGPHCSIDENYVYVEGYCGGDIFTWSEDFDSYDDGSSMHGQGGWEGWGNDPTWTAYVTSDQSRSNPHSVDINGTADLVHQFTGVDYGVWDFTCFVYIPIDFTGQSYFILLNTYGTVNNWSTQLRLDSVLGVIESEFEGAQLGLIYDQWVELRVQIDFDADNQQIYYNGSLLSSKSWTEGLSGGGALNLGAVDLFAGPAGATTVYYDDFTLELIPELVWDEDSAFIHCVAVGDMYPPVITDVTLTPSDPLDTEPGFGWEHFSATVTDDVAVDIVQLNITYPDLHIEIIPMSLSRGTYTCNTTLTDPCDYSYHIYATDTFGRISTSTPEDFFLPMNQDVDENGKVHFMDLIAVSLMYNAEGPGYPAPSSYGWVREDVDNNGKVHFMDLIAISLAYNDEC